MESNKVIVSVIVTTKNEETHLENCLKSIKSQSYKKIELIAVDNNSKDNTAEIAKKYTKLFFNKGPERSAQRNFGFKKSHGEYLLFVDADMVLEPGVVKDCVDTLQEENAGAVIIPEKSKGIGFWAKVKAFERSFYIGDDSVEAARFYERKIFDEAEGFDENQTGPEDWDLSDRVRKFYKIARIKSFITHDEGKLSLFELLKRKYYYAKSIRAYLSKNKKNTMSRKTILIFRPVFYKNPAKIISHPVLFSAMIFMLTLELISGFLGFMQNR